MDWEVKNKRNMTEKGKMLLTYQKIAKLMRPCLDEALDILFNRRKIKSRFEELAEDLEVYYYLRCLWFFAAFLLDPHGLHTEIKMVDSISVT